VTLPTDLPVLAFPDLAALEAWLEAEHATAPGLYVKLARKGAGVPSVTYPELVESALCFGWIDGRSNRFDDRFYLQRITPRRARSVWSQKNVDAVEVLTAAGRMRPAGLAAVEAAKADGRWERAYAGSATITVPDDLAEALAAEPAAQREFEALDGRNRYAASGGCTRPAPRPRGRSGSRRSCRCSPRAAGCTDQLSAVPARSRQKAVSCRRHQSISRMPAAMTPTPTTRGGPTPSHAWPV
jgi:uncharacterized protein YdeI (YjbR/CyaY-like superfamily)